MYQQESFGQAFKRGWLMMPPGLRWILTINVVVFFGMLIGGSGFSNWLNSIFGFYSDPVVTFTQPWRVVTYMFLHGNFLHIAFNMLWLWFLGRMVEQQLGTLNFLTIYFGAGIGGALLNTLVTAITGGGDIPTIGASGAVFGIMVAFAMLFPTFKLMLLLLPPIEARFLVAGLILIDLLLISSQDGVARIVHIGGAFWGWALVKLYFRGYHYDLWISSFLKKFRRPDSPPPPRSKGPRNKNMHTISDAEILDETEQNELDRILEKISKSGYEGLSDDEKRTLFELSKRN